MSTRHDHARRRQEVASGFGPVPMVVFSFPPRKHTGHAKRPGYPWRVRRTTSTLPRADATEMLSDVASLVERVGSSTAPSAWPPGVPPHSIATLPGLKAWLTHFRQEVLGRRDWPATLQAWDFARQGNARDLLALDQAWGIHAVTLPFAESSRRLGQRQLNRLRALRDQRVITRYLEAIEAGRAQGWHPLVYGVYLAVFNLPLRQGLVNFGAQTLNGLARSVNRSSVLSEDAIIAAVDAEVALLPTSLPSLPDASLFETRPPVVLS